MKRTLTLSLLLGLIASAMAQTPTVVEKPLPKSAGAKSATQGSAPSSKPAAAHVKVVAVPAASAKPSAVVAKSAAKSAVIAVQSAPKPAAAAPQKIAVVPQRVAVAQPKTSVAVSKPAAASVAVKVTPAVATHPVAAAKPMPATKAGPAVKTVAVPVTQAGNTRDPFNKNKKPESKKSIPVQAKMPEKSGAGTTVAVNESKPAAGDKKPETKKLSAEAHRDPFVSPVVRLGSTGSGCSSGKRCLAIDQIALKGVVRSETGMIAVVVNSMSKAYFLRENDPVFNGYVTKITPDSIVFKETFHDKVGKPLTRDVTKTISRPAA
jgi:Tfp pilus assembly protein PilP